MSDWPRKTAERLIAVDTEQAERKAHSEEEKRILQLKAPRLWQELRDGLETNCEKLNAEMGKKVLEFEVWPISEARVRKVESPALLRLEFDPEAYRVRYSCGAGRGEYQFGVNTDATVVFEDAYHRQFSTEEVAARLLDLLLASPF